MNGYLTPQNQRIMEWAGSCKPWIYPIIILDIISFCLKEQRKMQWQVDLVAQMMNSGKSRLDFCLRNQGKEEKDNHQPVEERY